MRAKSGDLKRTYAVFFRVFLLYGSNDVVLPGLHNRFMNRVLQTSVSKRVILLMCFLRSRTVKGSP